MIVDNIVICKYEETDPWQNMKYRIINLKDLNDEGNIRPQCENK